MVRSIFSPEDYFHIIVFGGKSSKEIWQREFEELDSSGNIFLDFGYDKCWGTFKIVSATLDSMKRFARFDYDYFINLSGHCYPLKSTSEIKQFLRDKNSAYVEWFKLPIAFMGPTGGLHRIKFSYYKHPVFEFRARALNWLSGYEKFENRRFLRLPKFQTHLPYELSPYIGSQWFCITKKHVNYILEYVRNKPKLIGFFKRSFAPDELFFQTVLLNSTLRETVVKNNLRYIYWGKKRGPFSPLVLTMEDADELLNSPALFARKFDIEEDERILDLIDRHRNQDNNA